MATTKNRLQITLNDEQYKYLCDESARLGVTKSALIALLLADSKKNQQPTLPASNS